MKAVAEFIPRHLEKALDLARHVATFGRIEFSADGIKLRIIDPAKVIYVDLALHPDTYKCDEEFGFGIHLGMLYKLFKSLDNNESIEILADESVMKIDQSFRHHTLVAQEMPFGVPEIVSVTGPSVQVQTKLLQKYIRALANIAPAVSVNYVPHADTLFLESVNSMYRTLFSIKTETPNEGAEEYNRQFTLKFVEAAVNPSLSDTVSIVFGDLLCLRYEQSGLSMDVMVAPYTEG